LIDVFAQADPEATQGGRRIDYVFDEHTVAEWIDGAEVVSRDASDHAALVVDLKIPDDLLSGYD
jgi:endonuclease/exonuclease/phosphatase (EEP) superfamily protein YafD